ncbi:MAG: class I SAM-dependent methyltransferase [Actinomycetota bacterium]|nr:class I SAM-dependent methyltransferase [Actinomycetota bacterium]
MAEHAAGRPEHKFDPARAGRLDAPERDAYLPDDRLIDLLELEGGETVVDYGAGTGRLALAAERRLGGRGRVVAVDESEEMLAHLRARLSAAGSGVEPFLIAANRVPLPDASADRVIAVNLLHEVRGEAALAEMRRLLRPEGILLVADWERGRDPERPTGPPEHILYTEDEAVAELERAGFAVDRREGGFPYHFSLLAQPVAAR